MTHGAWRQRALILQGRPVWLKVVQKPSPSRAAIALTWLARRARDLDLVVGEESLEALLLGDAGRCSAPSLESLRLAQRAVDDVGVGRPERAAGGAELVAEDLDAPYVEAAQGKRKKENRQAKGGMGGRREKRKKERKQTRQTRDGTRTRSPPARAGFWKDDQGDRWGSPAPLPMRLMPFE